jgi:hypothetical protein
MPEAAAIGGLEASGVVQPTMATIDSTGIARIGLRTPGLPA